MHSLKLEYNDLPNKNKRDLQLRVYNKVVAERGGQFLQQPSHHDDPSQKAGAPWFALSKADSLKKISQHFRTELLSHRKRIRDVASPKKVDIQVNPHRSQLMEIFNKLLSNNSKSISECSEPPTQLLQHVHNWQQTLQSLGDNDTKQKSDPKTEDTSSPEYQQAVVKEEDEIDRIWKSYSTALSKNDSIDTDLFAGFPRPFYYDTLLHKASSWNELQGRVLPSDSVEKIIATYAFHCAGIHKLQGVRKRSNSLVRVYKCKTCDPDAMHWSVTVSAIPGTGRKQWQVRPSYISLKTLRSSFKQTKDSYLSTDMKCTCIDKPKIPDQLFFNITWVRDLTFKHHQESTKEIDQNIVNVFQSNNIPPDKLPIKTQRYNAIGQLLVIHSQILRHQYHILPQHLLEFNNLNPDSSVALQSDSQGRFFRAFIGCPSGIAQAQKYFTVPILFIDCCHYQCPQYDGVIIILNSKTGNGEILPLAFGIIPIENVNNISWFLQLCALHGINLDCALFTDQGPLISAAKQLHEHTSIRLSLMLCTQHLLRNIRHRFGDLQQSHHSTLNRHMDIFSNCSDIQSFFTSVEAMAENLLMAQADIKLVTEIVFYVLRIHPSHWSVFGNTNTFIHADYLFGTRKLLQSLVSACMLSKVLEERKSPYVNVQSLIGIIHRCNNQGNQDEKASLFSPRRLFSNYRICPRYNTARNNPAESLAELFRNDGVRYKTPPVSMWKFFQEYNKLMSTILNTVKRLNRSPLAVPGMEYHTKLLGSSSSEILDECKIYPWNHGDNVDEFLSYLRDKPSLHQFSAQLSQQQIGGSGRNNHDDLQSSNRDRRLNCLNEPCKKLNISCIGAAPIQGRGAIVQYATNLPSSVDVCSGISNTNVVKAPFLNFTKKPDKEQSHIIEEALKEANESEKMFLKVTDNLWHFQPHYLYSVDILKFQEEEWLNNCIVDLFFWALNNQAIRHWQQTGECSNCFFPTTFASMLGAQAWSHTEKPNPTEQSKKVYVRGREYSTKEISKRFTSSIDVFKFKKLFFPILENEHFHCMVVYVKERRIALYDSKVTDPKNYLHYLVLMFRFLVDEHMTKRGSLLIGDWTLEFANSDISPQQVDTYSCGLSTVMVADCLSLDLQLDFSKDKGHFDRCREQMALKVLERKDGKQFNPCPACVKDTEDEDDQPDHPSELKLLEASYIHLVHWCQSHHVVRAAPFMVDGRSYIKMFPSIKPKENGHTASQAIDELDTMMGSQVDDPDAMMGLDDNEVEYLGVSKAAASSAAASSAAASKVTDTADWSECEDSEKATDTAEWLECEDSEKATDTADWSECEESEDDSSENKYSQKRSINIADIQSISNQGFCIRGTFSSKSEQSNHIASLTVFFDSQCAPVEVLNRCEKHLSETTNRDCPCRCVVQIHHHFLKEKVPDWPGSESDFYYLYPTAYQQRKTIKYYQIMERSSKQLLLDVPSMKNYRSQSDDSSPILDAAPKYKDKISGRRFRSKGEINSSARKPMHKREGGRLSKSASAVARANPSKNLILSLNSNDNVLYETRNYAYSAGSDTKSTTVSEVVSLIDTNASGCVFVCGPEFVVESTTDAEQLTATVAGASLGKRTNVPLKTMAFLATTVEGHSVICLFHNSAHIEDTSRNLFILSLTQMESAGVKVNIDYNNKDAGDSPETLEKDGYSFELKRSPQMFRYDKRLTPFIELRPFPKEHYQQMEKVDMTSREAWVPPRRLELKKQCSICGGTDCRRPRCLQLHSFGLGVVAPRDLQPGKYFVYQMKKRMSDIVNNSVTNYPLELHAKADDNLDELLPLALPTDDEYHLNLGRNHNNDKKNELRQMEQFKLEGTTSTKDFLSQIEGQERNTYHGTSPTNSKSFQSVFLSKVQEIVLKKAKVTANTIVKLKERLRLSDDVPLLMSQDSEVIQEELSQENLISQSDFNSSLLESPNNYSQESVNMMNKNENVLFRCDAILRHQGPVKPSSKDYKGSKFNVQVKWGNDELTWEPLKNIVLDSPLVVAEYIVSKNLYNLLEERLWGRKVVKEHVNKLKTESKKEQKMTREKTNRYTGKKMKKETKASTRPKRKKLNIR